MARLRPRFHSRADWNAFCADARYAHGWLGIT